MRERGWRLTYPGVDFEFGGIDDTADPFRRNIGRVSVRSHEENDAAISSEDVQRPRRDGMRFGQDYRGGVTHTFTLLMRGRDRAEAEQLLGLAARAWRGDGVRDDADQYAALTTRRGGLEWTVFGRPRKFQPNRERIDAGEISATCTFDTRDDLTYGPQQSTRIDLRAVTAGGFRFPIVFPVVMGPTTTRQGLLNVGGTVPAAVSLELHGPITNPVVRLGDVWRFKLETSLGVGRVVTADPEVGSVIDQTGASFGGALARGTRLDDLQLAPGLQQQLVLSGQDTSGSAYLVARWRDTYTARG